METDQQAIYAEIEKSPVDEKVRERFKAVPYAMIRKIRSSELSGHKTAVASENNYGNNETGQGFPVE